MILKKKKKNLKPLNKTKSSLSNHLGTVNLVSTSASAAPTGPISRKNKHVLPSHATYENKDDEEVYNFYRIQVVLGSNLLVHLLLRLYWCDSG